MKTRKTDNEKIQELIALSEANPDMEIITMVYYEVCASDDHCYWLGSIGKIEKDIVYYAEQAEGELVLIGEDKIYEHISDEIEEEDFDKELEEDDYTHLTNARIESLIILGEIREKIIVYIELPEV